MERHLRDRVAASRQRAFVARAAELELFDARLAAADSQGFAVLFVQGAGGVGKTALLRMFAERAAAAGFAVTRIDSHDVRPNSRSFLRVAAPAVAVDPVVVLVDSYELLEPLDGWLREEFVPGLPAGSVVVIAGRRPLPAGWRSDPGWRDLLRVIKLGNLAADDAALYLAGAGVPDQLCSRAEATIHGHPLALALVVDLFAQRGPSGLGDTFLSDPDMVALLMARLLDGVPDDRHRAALAACALARFTTEPLLRAVLEIDDAHPVFEWLRGLSCVEVGTQGLYPHDLARDVLEADLRWRDETRHRVLTERILGYTRQRIGTQTGHTRQDAIFDLFFSVRTDPISRRYWKWETSSRSTRPRSRSCVARRGWQQVPFDPAGDN